MMIPGSKDDRRELSEQDRPGDMRGWMDLQHRMEEAIPPVDAQSVRRAAHTVVEAFGTDAGDVLSMLGITRETLRDGLSASGRESAA